ncbi:MAG: monovalent cation/H+ antiporter complex subunit F [Oceanipulchritudo sp.]
MILPYALQISEVLLALSVLVGLYRLVKGPTIVDRIIAFDLVVLTVVAFTALLSIEEDTPHFVELILVVSLLGFFGTVALVLSMDSIRKKGGSL